MYKYLVLGAGVGKAIAYSLLQDPESRVVIADVDHAKAYTAALNINKFTPYNICRCTSFEVGRTATSPLFREFNVVISALPARYNCDLAASAIKAGVNFCDLGGVVEVTQKIKELHREAEEARVSIIPDCGLMPGLGMILARELVEEAGRFGDVRILAGGLPQKPRPPVFYQKVFSLEGLKRICFDRAPVLEDGQIIWKSPFSDYEIFQVPELEKFSPDGTGRVEVFTTAGASIAPWTFKEMWRVDNFSEKTVRWPGFVDFVKDIPPDNFDETILPHINVPVDGENPDLVWMKVEFQGFYRKSITLVDFYDGRTGFSAMERTTGFSAAIMARLVARGYTRKGVHTPEMALGSHATNIFLAEIEKLFQVEQT